MKNNFSIKESLSFGWHHFFGNWKFWLIAFIISSGSWSLSGANYKSSQNSNNTYGTASNSQSYTNVRGAQTSVYSQLPQSSVVTPASKSALPILAAPFILLGIPFLIVFAVATFVWIILIISASAILRMGYVHLSIDAVRGNPLDYKTILSDVSVKKALRLLTLGLLYGLLVFIGFIFFIIPGIYFAVKYFFAGTVLIDKNVGIREAFITSGNITKGNRFKLCLFFITLTLVGVAGILCLFIGIIPAVIIGGLATAFVYVRLSDTATTKETIPLAVTPSVQ